MNKTVVIGGIAGGVSYAARLRRLDEEVVVVMLGRGEYISYASYKLPYHVGDMIESRDALPLQTPEAMKKKFEVDMRMRNGVVIIDREKKTVLVKRVDSGEIYEEAYDTLVISTESSPMRPNIPGIESPRIKTLRMMPGTNDIRVMVRKQGAKAATVIDGGFIRLEMAENLKETGLEVSLIETMDQVMAPLDYEIALLLHENVLQNGVDLYLGDGVSSFAKKKGQVTVTLGSGDRVTVDFVILAIGVRPDSELVKGAGLALDRRGGIVVDEYLRTSDKDIYAVGDVIEVEDFVWKEPTMAPLAGPANEQGRIAANSITSGQEWYQGTQGTSVAKVPDLTAATAGTNGKTLLKRGLARGKDYGRVLITQNSHARYCPRAVPLTLKLLFPMDGKRIFGAQIVGWDDVDKRIDTIAVTIRLGAETEALEELELTYTPPHSSAKDSVDMAGFVAEDVRAGLVSFADWDEAERDPAAVVLDVREEAELMVYTIPGARHTPLGQLRSRLKELDQETEIIAFCAIGMRAYNGARVLMQYGFQYVKVYPGGMRFYQSTHYENHVTPILMAASMNDGSKTVSAPDTRTAGTVSDGIGVASTPNRTDAAPAQDSTGTTSMPSTSGIPKATTHLGCNSLQCPGLIMEIFEMVKGIGDDDMAEVSTSDPGFTRSIDAWCRHTGDVLVPDERRGNNYVACIRECTNIPRAVMKDTPEGKIIIAFSGDLGKVLASLVIANGAAAMERPVTMLPTFWGLTAPREEERQPVKKTFIESMFGAMFPHGSKRLKLSKINMAGIGTTMMKKTMNGKSADSLGALIQKAMASGVKIFTCIMNMDMMGIKEEELIDSVELGGVDAHLGDAKESDVNLFI